MLFSVIIPTRNRPEMLDRCLTALDRQTFPRDGFEVIVVDDGGTVALEGIVARHAGVRLLRQENRGPAVARNAGIAAGTGEFIVLTDDDCRPESGWLAAYSRAVLEMPGAGLGGDVKPAPENGICGDASQLLVSYLYNYTDTRMPFFCTNNVAFPRRLLLEIGGFDETFPLAAAEDRDICGRWNARYPLRRAPEASVVHHQALDFAGFVRQQFRYGRGAFQFHRRRIQRGDGGVRVAPFRFYSRMLRFPWGVYPAGMAALHMVLLVISQVANAAGYFYERGRPDKS
jgi:glycosyltransferase involved in cell wall biosynthesis